MLFTLFIVGHGGDEQLETKMSTLEEKNKGENNLPQRRHQRTRRGRRKVENTTRIRQTKRAPSTTGGYSESRTPAIDDQTLTHSLTLVPVSESEDGDMNMEVGIVLTIFIRGDGGESKCCNDFDEHSGRREREPGRLAIHAVVDDHNQPRVGGQRSETNLLR